MFGCWIMKCKGCEECVFSEKDKIAINKRLETEWKTHIDNVEQQRKLTLQGLMILKEEGTFNEIWIEHMIKRYSK